MNKLRHIIFFFFVLILISSQIACYKTVPVSSNQTAYGTDNNIGMRRDGSYSYGNNYGGNNYGGNTNRNNNYSGAYSYKDEVSQDSYPNDPISVKAVDLGSQGLPWESWKLYYDLEGNKLDNLSILEGDELTKRGRYSEAKEKYFSARAIGNSIAVREALAIRLASTELALGHPQEALAVLSSLLRKLGREPDQVSVDFSLMLAFSYGRTRDFDQSLAWFTRAHRLSPVNSNMSFSTDRGLRLMIESLETEEIQNFRSVWRQDTYINGFIARELSRRAAGAEANKENAFWQNKINQTAIETVQASAEQIGSIAVLLPFSGKFSELGKATKDGFELSLDGQSLRSNVKLRYYDTAGDPAKAAAIARSLDQDKPDVVLGPLLSDTSSAVAQVLANKAIPLLCFSKQEDFPVSNNIFRLGATAKSQIESLVDASIKKGMSKFALIYPDEELSREFAFQFKNVLSSYDSQIVYEVAYKPGSSNSFINISKELSELPYSIDGIFFPDDLSMATKFWVLAPESIRSKTRLLGTARWDENQELSRSKTLLQRAIFVNPFFEQSKNQYISQFINTFNKLNKYQPNFLAAQGFDAGTLLLTALRESKKFSQKISEALFGIQRYEGLTGLITIRDTGELERRFKVVELDQFGLQEIQ